MRRYAIWICILIVAVGALGFLAYTRLTTVPDIRGTKFRDALAELGPLGLDATVTARDSYTEQGLDPFSEVASVAPAPGSLILRGSSIQVLLFFPAPQEAQVPNVVAMSGDDARATLGRVGLLASVAGSAGESQTAGAAEAIRSATAPTILQGGTVVSQTPAGGTAARGSTVRLQVVGPHGRGTTDGAAQWRAIHGAAVIRYGSQSCTCHQPVAGCGSGRKSCHTSAVWKLFGPPPTGLIAPSK